MNAIKDSVVVSSSFDAFTDEELLIEYRTFGNERCFGEIIRRYKPALERYLRYRYDLSVDQVEDALQTTFVRVWEKIGQFDVSRSFKPWIYRIATSQTIDLLRRKNRQNPGVSLDATDADDSAWIDNLADDSPNPADELERLDYESAVRRLAKTLPMDYRDVVEKVFFEGMTFQKAAYVLNLASATVARRLRKALDMMSGMLLLSGKPDASCDRLRKFVESCESL